MRLQCFPSSLSRHKPRQAGWERRLPASPCSINGDCLVREPDNGQSGASCWPRSLQGKPVNGSASCKEEAALNEITPVRPVRRAVVVPVRAGILLASLGRRARPLRPAPGDPALGRRAVAPDRLARPAHPTSLASLPGVPRHPVAGGRRVPARLFGHHGPAVRAEARLRARPLLGGRRARRRSAATAGTVPIGRVRVACGLRGSRRASPGGHASRLHHCHGQRVRPGPSACSRISSR